MIELKSGDNTGLGSLRRYTWKGWLPYRLAFDLRITRIEPLVALEGIASGDLEGVGRWQFSNRGPIAMARYDWNVRTTRNWMNWLAPLARPIFQWNHDVIMRQGVEGLARLLNARLLKAGDSRKEREADADV